MSPELEQIQQIEAYIEGRLSVEELSDFEAKLQSNPDLKAEVEYQELVASSVVVAGQNELKTELNQIHDDLFGGGGENAGGKRPAAGGGSGSKLWMYVSVPAIIVGSLVYLFSSEEEEMADNEAPATTEEVEKHIVKLEDKETTAVYQEAEATIEEASAESNPVVQENTPKVPKAKTPAPKAEEKASDRQAGEIVVDNTEHGEFDYLIDQQGTHGTYTFDGRSEFILYGNYTYEEIAVDYFIDNDHYYLFHGDKIYRLEVSATPSKLVEETDPEIIRYLKL